MALGTCKPSQPLFPLRVTRLPLHNRLRWLAGVPLLAGGPAALAAAQDCLPFDMAPPAAYVSGAKRVLAHYFNRFPLSFDNRPGDRDYYATQYLQPTGEHSKWALQGGFLRSRPLPVQTVRSGNYRLENLRKEVAMALSRGIGGFTFDVLGIDDLRSGGPLDTLLSAAASVDPDFAVVLMPDMAALGEDLSGFQAVVRRAATYPGLFRTADRRLLVAPFLAERFDSKAWSAALMELEHEGVPVALAPTFLAFDPSRAEALAPLSTAFGSFATPLSSEAAGIRAAVVASHAMGKHYMAGVPTQGYRPKDFVYWESHGSEAFRSSWAAAIDSGADWVQLTTWNDYSESTQVAPYGDSSDGVGTGFFDLNAYFASWFISGHAPEIRKDAIYYFYRRQHIADTGPKDTRPVANAVPGIPGEDRIEVVSLLIAPATLQIRTDLGTTTLPAASGLSSHAVPLGHGNPEFVLTRPGWHAGLSGITAAIRGDELPSGHTDLTYWSGGGVLSGCLPAQAQGQAGP